jgi:hypothetical protein
VYVMTVFCLTEGKYVAFIVSILEAVSVEIANIRFLL